MHRWAVLLGTMNGGASNHEVRRMRCTSLETTRQGQVEIEIEIEIDLPPT
jgi:hypothetical protein